MSAAPPPTLFQDAVIIVMTALGMSHYSPELFLGGVTMALAGSFAASRVLDAGMVPRAKALGFLGTFSTGLFVSVMAGAAADTWAPETPLVLIMGLAGLISSFVLPLILKVASRFSSRGDELADRLADKILPEDDKQ